jgi:hypothetical protein
MKTCRRAGGIAPPFLTSALVGGESSASRPGRFTTGETGPGTHSVGGLVGPRPGADAMEKRSLSPLPEVEPRFLGRLARSLVTILTELC